MAPLFSSSCTVVAPTIKKQILFTNCIDEEDSQPQRNFLSSDGEGIIMRQAYKDDTMKAFEVPNIDYEISCSRFCS